MDEQTKESFRAMDIDQLKYWITVEMWRPNPLFSSTDDYEWIAEELIEKAANL